MCSLSYWLILVFCFNVAHFLENRETDRKEKDQSSEIMSLAIQAILLILCSPVPIFLGDSLLVTAVLKCLL